MWTTPKSPVELRTLNTSPGFEKFSQETKAGVYSVLREYDRVTDSFAHLEAEAINPYADGQDCWDTNKRLFEVGFATVARAAAETVRLVTKNEVGVSAWDRDGDVWVQEFIDLERRFREAHNAN